MPTINICGNDYKVPKPVASYLAEACDALWTERNELAMIQAGTVFEDRADPMAVFSQEYNRLKQQAFAWGLVCQRVGLPLGIHPDEVVKEILRLGPSGLTLRQADGCADQGAPTSSVESGAAAAYTDR